MTDRRKFIKGFLSLGLGSVSTKELCALENNCCGDTCSDLQFYLEAERIIKEELHTGEYCQTAFPDGTIKRYYSVNPIGRFAYVGKSGSEYKFMYEMNAKDRRIYAEDLTEGNSRREVLKLKYRLIRIMREIVSDNIPEEM